MDNWLQLQRFKKAKAYINKGDSLLDIGCEKCHFFDYIKDLTDNVSGIDPAHYDDRIELDGHAKVYKGYFPEVLADGDRYNVITMLAVLEHIKYEDQIKVAKGVTHHLNIGGRLIITVPDAKVDLILSILQKVKIVDADTLDEHYGYDINLTPEIFVNDKIKIILWEKVFFKFQLL